jgi:hypothetical protein
MGSDVAPRRVKAHVNFVLGFNTQDRKSSKTVSGRSDRLKPNNNAVKGVCVKTVERFNGRKQLLLVGVPANTRDTDPLTGTHLNALALGIAPVLLH